jgi:Cys-tRNA(Pro) deacylase
MRAAMARKDHVSETPATALLKARGVAFTEHPYEYVEHGGAEHSAQVLRFDPFSVVKTLVMEDEKARPLLVLMHGNRKVSTKNLARQVGAKSIEPCKPEVANRHSGYLVGGTSPFGTRKEMPVYVEETILGLPRICINGGRRGFLVGIDPKVLVDVLGARSVEPCKPEVANRHSGYLVGGTSPFGTRKEMPVYVEESILALPRIVLNGGRRGYLVGIEPAVLVKLLGAKTVNCALAE